jgi:hypothetical protein
VTYGYRVREVSPVGGCNSEPASCVEASTTGACTAPPAFAGVASATSAGTIGCAIELDWSAATTFCGGPVTYSVYRGTTPTFTPSAANRIATGVAATSYSDTGAASGVVSHYVVRAIDGTSLAEDSNLGRRAARANGPVVDGTFVTGAEVGDPPLDTADSNLTGDPKTFAPEHAGWHFTDARKRSGLRSFWSTDDDNLCVTIEGDVELTASEVSTLSFWTAWDIQAGFDGGVVEVSTNGGANWSLLTPQGGYPSTITGGGTLCGIPQGSGAFTGLNQLTFTQRTVSLSAFAGQEVRLRWNYRTNATTHGEGWYVDDIAVTHAQVPGSCSPGALFLDGFESGSVSAWSDAEGD